MLLIDNTGGPLLPVLRAMTQGLGTDIPLQLPNQIICATDDVTDASCPGSHRFFIKPRLCMLAKAPERCQQEWDCMQH